MNTILNSPKLPTIAWMGGSRSPSPANISARQASILKYLFGEQVETFRKYWGDYPNWNTMHIFFRRALADSWATIRNDKE
jgi:hypothetical protein